MSDLEKRLYQEIDSWDIYDPHSHINPLFPASKSLDDILSYHYYTELAHSVGLSKARLEAVTGLNRVKLLFDYLPKLENTIQYSWLLEICQTLLNHNSDKLLPIHIDALEKHFAVPQEVWMQKVITQTRLKCIFLTNDFWDDLTTFDTRFYIPCLRVDDLVFKSHTPEVQDRFLVRTGFELNQAQMDQGLEMLFAYFKKHNAKAAAISLPPDFSPQPTRVFSQETASQYIFWKVAEFCQAYQMPFDLMIGVNRQVYPQGVYQGQDLFDQRTSLLQYKTLFNSFPDVLFPLSVLTSSQNQELVAYSWIFPNVLAMGHWWYMNAPSTITRDLTSRLEAVPASKLVGYYSDAYKLEFVLPKFKMYRRCLARVLATEFVQGRNWPEARAITLARTLLIDNVQQRFQLES